MARFAKGSRALSISDRSGAAFPYKEMVKEWTGALVHTSEFEAKQPQLQPHPVGADPQALLHARPARTEFPVQDILPNNPFTTTASSTSVSVSYPANNFNAGTTYIRFQAVKQNVGGVVISTLELATTLNETLTDSDTTITLTDATEFPTAGYIVIEKINSTSGAYENETIQYTGKSGNDLTGCTRGTSSPYKGNTPPATTAGTHASGAKVYGSYLATAVATTVQTGAQPSTVTEYNFLTVALVSNATTTVTGGGFQCTIGPLNDRA
jgi:hypothetical protein